MYRKKFKDKGVIFMKSKNAARLVYGVTVIFWRLLCKRSVVTLCSYCNINLDKSLYKVIYHYL